VETRGARLLLDKLETKSPVVFVTEKKEVGIFSLQQPKHSLYVKKVGS
jgi:hypothetical protein